LETNSLTQSTQSTQYSPIESIEAIEWGYTHVLENNTLTQVTQITQDREFEYYEYFEQGYTAEKDDSVSEETDIARDTNLRQAMKITVITVITVSLSRICA